MAVNFTDAPLVEGHYCWREIGVYGNRSCRRLKEFVHCRNCPVFTAAARESLARANVESEDDTSVQWVPKLLDRRAQTRKSVLLFKLGEEWLGLDSQVISEVSDNQQARRIAHRATGLIEGMVNIRGELRLCLSLLGVLTVEATTPLSGERARLVMVRDDSSIWVFRAAHVKGVIGYAPTQLSPPPARLGEVLKQHVEGILRVEDLTVSVLNNQALFNSFKQAVFE
jgi:chemotaxis-related protein WspD